MDTVTGGCEGAGTRTVAMEASLAAFRAASTQAYCLRSYGQRCLEMFHDKEFARRENAVSVEKADRHEEFAKAYLTDALKILSAQSASGEISASRLSEVLSCIAAYL